MIFSRVILLVLGFLCAYSLPEVTVSTIDRRCSIVRMKPGAGAKAVGIGGGIRRRLRHSRCHRRHRRHRLCGELHVSTVIKGVDPGNRRGHQRVRVRVSVSVLTVAMNVAEAQHGCT